MLFQPKSSLPEAYGAGTMTPTTVCADHKIEDDPIATPAASRKFLSSSVNSYDLFPSGQFTAP